MFRPRYLRVEGSLNSTLGTIDLVVEIRASHWPYMRLTTLAELSKLQHIDSGRPSIWSICVMIECLEGQDTKGSHIMYALC